jgi:hypothetical protein
MVDEVDEAFFFEAIHSGISRNKSLSNEFFHLVTQVDQSESTWVCHMDHSSMRKQACSITRKKNAAEKMTLLLEID